MNSPFASILQGTDRSMVVAENEHFIAVLEKKPLVLGHVILISKRLEDNVFDLPSEELATLMVFSKRVSYAIQKTIPCRKVGVAVIGLETRHAHMHLVPIHSADDLNFTRPKLDVAEAQLIETLNALKTNLYHQ